MFVYGQQAPTLWCSLGNTHRHTIAHPSRHSPIIFQSPTRHRIFSTLSRYRRPPPIYHLNVSPSPLHRNPAVLLRLPLGRVCTYLSVCLSHSVAPRRTMALSSAQCIFELSSRGGHISRRQRQGRSASVGVRRQTAVRPWRRPLTVIRTRRDAGQREGRGTQPGRRSDTGAPETATDYGLRDRAQRQRLNERKPRYFTR